METRHIKNESKIILIDRTIQVGHLTYIENDTSIDVDHTFINRKFRGQNLGVKLMETLRKYQLEVRKEVIGTCPYIEKNIDYFILNK